MKNYFLVFVLAFIFVSCASTPVEKKVNIKKYNLNEKNIKYSLLRKNIGWDKNYLFLCNQNRPLEEVSKSLEDQNWNKAISLSQKWLEQCPIDIRIHFFTAIAYDKINKKQESSNHFKWVRGLMDSIFKTGNGRTAKRALKTISISEEYDVMYILNLKFISQSLVQDGNIKADKMKVLTRQGKETYIFFYPEAHFHRILNMKKM